LFVDVHWQGASNSDYQSVNKGESIRARPGGSPPLQRVADRIQSLRISSTRRIPLALEFISDGRAILKAIKFFFVAVAIVAFVPVLSAQQSKGAPVAPVPPQIAAAQKAFISNAGGESFESVIDETVFNGGPDRPYNAFYATMKTWGRYQLVSSPADADLVFEVSWVLTDTGLKLPVLGQLRLVVIDPKTHVTLWNFTEYVRGAMLLGNRDKNFDQAMTTIVNRMKILATQPAAPAAAPGNR
jgi:hypothetical protein